MSEIELKAADLVGGIDRVKHAMASDEARPILAGMHFEVGEHRLQLAAADGYRIAWADLKPEPVADRDVSFTLSRADVLFLLRWLKTYKAWEDKRYPTPVTLTVSEERVEFVIGRPGTVLRRVAPVLSFWQVQGTFPDYAKLIPEKADKPTIALNVRYLEDVGKAMREASPAGIVKIYVTDPLAPALIEAYGSAGGELIVPVKTAEFASVHNDWPAIPEPAESEAVAS